MIHIDVGDADQSSTPICRSGTWRGWSRADMIAASVLRRKGRDPYLPDEGARKDMDDYAKDGPVLRSVCVSTVLARVVLL